MKHRLTITTSDEEAYRNKLTPESMREQLQDGINAILPEGCTCVCEIVSDEPVSAVGLLRLPPPPFSDKIGDDITHQLQDSDEDRPY